MTYRTTAVAPLALREATPLAPRPPRLLDRVRDAIRARHYSRRTENAYVHWIKRYIFFHGKRHPGDMGAPEVTTFLTSLAVDGHVAASTQNQALSALLFLYRAVLAVALPWLGCLSRRGRRTIGWSGSARRRPLSLSVRRTGLREKSHVPTKACHTWGDGGWIRRAAGPESRRWALKLSTLALVLVLMGAPLPPLYPAEAQQGGKVSRVGFLRFGSTPPPFIEGFRQGLRELGYVEGQNIIIEYGLAQRAEQLPDVAAGLVRRKVDVLVASGVPSVLPAKNATSTIPVVFVSAIDPVATGVVASLRRPGGHVTGVTVMQAVLTGKRLELLKELLPKLSRIAVLVRATSPAAAQYVQEAEVAARILGISLQVLTVHEPRDLEGAFSAAQGASALLQSDDAVFTAHRIQIAELALKHRLPTVSGLREMVEAGSLMAYGAHTGELHRRAATYVDKILKGAKPADLPIEQPTRFELVVNLKTAKALGLVIPQSLLSRADEVIQ